MDFQEIIDQVCEQSGIPEPYRICDAVALIQGAVNFVLYPFEPGFVVHMPTTAQAKLYCQPVRFSRVLINLINNANEALEGYETEKWIRFEFVESEKDVCLEVTNNGPPIPACMADEIMLDYFTTKKGSQGLGLGICKAIMEAHGGSISLDTSRTLTTFVLRLPKN